MSFVVAGIETDPHLEHDEYNSCKECKEGLDRRRKIKQALYIHLMLTQGLDLPDGLKRDDFTGASKLACPSIIEKINIQEEFVENEESLFVYRPIFLPPGNVVGVAFAGTQRKSGPAVLRVYVKKKPIDAYGRSLPQVIAGLPVESLEVGEIYGCSIVCAAGDSVGPDIGGYGTLGCIVKEKDKSDNKYLLSNAHVLGQPGEGSKDIFHKEASDSSKTQVASWTKGIKLDSTVGVSNRMDAAIAKLEKDIKIDPAVREIGELKSVSIKAKEYLGVRKYGCATKDTIGVVTAVDADFTASIKGQSYFFEDQFEITGITGPLFADSGDSGSLVVEGPTDRPVGLLFTTGTAQNTAWATPISRILNHWRLEIVES